MAPVQAAPASPGVNPLTTPPATQFYVCGPSQVWASAGPFRFDNPTANAWKYIGWTRNGLGISIVPLLEPIAVDYAGLAPGDIAILGEEGRVSGVFSRYNEPNLIALASFLGPSGAFGQFGTNQLGSLLRNDGMDYALLVRCPYYVKPSMSRAGSEMVKGFCFYSAHIANPYEAVYSIRAKQPSVSWRAIPVFGSMASGSFVGDVNDFNASQVYSINVPQDATGSANWPVLT